METAFGWLGQIFEALLQFVPRLVIVRNTCQAIKWKRGGRVVAIARGSRTLYWPLLTDLEIIVVARQTVLVPPQNLVTSDGVTVGVRAVVVHHIADVVKAIGEKNWDVDSTITDIAGAAVVEEVMKRTFAELVTEIAQDDADGFNRALKDNCRRKLSPFGVAVDRVGLISFSECKVYSMMGTKSLMVGDEE